MKFKYIPAYNIPDAWRKTITAIYNEGDFFDVKLGSECTETKKLAVTIEIAHPEDRPLVDDKCITTNMEKVQNYTLEYLWTDSRKDETYTYGSRLRTPVDQIQKIVETLSKEPSNRQLTMTVRIPSDVDNEHPPCLTFIDLDTEFMGSYCYTVHTHCYFRSWDAYAGLPENIAGLQLFIEALVAEAQQLTSKYEFYTGRMILTSKNCHLYKRQYDFVYKLNHPEIKKVF
jgi:thymidylate synthase